MNKYRKRTKMVWKKKYPQTAITTQCGNYKWCYMEDGYKLSKKTETMYMVRLEIKMTKEFLDKIDEIRVNVEGTGVLNYDRCREMKLNFPVEMKHIGSNLLVKYV